VQVDGEVAAGAERLGELDRKRRAGAGWRCQQQLAEDQQALAQILEVAILEGRVGLATLVVIAGYGDRRGPLVPAGQLAPEPDRGARPILGEIALRDVRRLRVRL
jgi:hypothetical protein